LIIDDEPMVAGALKRILAAEHEVSTSGSGQVALDRIASGERYDVILCDLLMPGMNGVELYDTLMGTIAEQAQRMVFVTGGAFTPVTSSFLDRVPNQRIDKPFDAVGVRALVRANVG
ncbi:MAG: response regulator, partial [Gemmatimonadaceae bacterium]|nr:response regulator [Gemmatimonadaceae bacterium]